MSYDLRTLTEGYAALREKRATHESYVNKLKELEEQFKNQISIQLAVNQMKTCNFEGLGRIERSTRDHAEIRDYDKLCRFILSQGIAAQESGAPVEDALSLLQKRANLATISGLIESGVTAEEMGVEIVEKPIIKFTKTK